MVNYMFYKLGALFVAISAMLHLVSPIFARGLTQDALILLPIGALYLFFAWGLRAKMRWVAHLAFIILLLGTLIAFGFSFNGTTVPAWAYGSMALANTVALASLFICLWRNKPIRA